MFCRNCGNKLREGNLFCTACGAAVMGGDAAKETPKAPEQDDFVLSSTTTQETPKKKKSRKWIAPVASLCVVVAAVVAVLLNWNSIFGSLGSGTGSTEGSDENPDGPAVNTQSEDLEYMQRIEKESVGGLVDTVTGVYGTMLSQPISSNIGGDAEVSVYVGDAVINMLETQYAQQSGQTMDFGWLSKAVLDMDVDVGDSMTRMDMALALADQRLISLEVIMDMSQSVIYMGSQELSDVYAMLDMTEMGLDPDFYQQTMQKSEQLLQILPAEETLNRLLNKYVGIIIENLDEVEKTSQTLELDGLKQECTVLKVTIDAETMANVLTAVLEAAKTDADLKTIIEAYSDYYNADMASLYAEFDMVWEDVDMYQSFTESVESALSSLNSQKEDLAEETGKIVLHTYVDSADQVIGRKMIFEDEYDTYELYYYTVTEGGVFSFEAGIVDVLITGRGTVRSETLDAEYTLTIDGTQYLTLEIEDYDKTMAEAGYLNGTFRLEPTAELASQILGNSDAAAFADVALELTVSSVEDSMDLRLDVLTNDTLLVGVGLSCRARASEPVTAPDNTVDAMDQEALMNWVAGFDFEQIISNLEAAGVPQELVDTAEQFLLGLKNSALGSEGTAEPDYTNEF